MINDVDALEATRARSKSSFVNWPTPSTRLPIQHHAFVQERPGAHAVARLPQGHVVVPELPTPAAGEVLVKNHFLGINESDISFTSGGYGIVDSPFVSGLEAAGVVEALSEGVENVKVGDAVVFQKFGAFSEYVVVPAATVIKTPELSSSMVPLTVSGLSASIALEQVGQMGTGETVLVTAAAGATGQFVVQLAKLAGNHVIGTCSSDEKVEFLKSLGCDRVINYKKEDVDAVLKTEYLTGINLVFESVGGDLFKTAVANLAVLHRLIVFGYISGYHGDTSTKPMLVSELNPGLLFKSASIHGFLLFNHAKHIPSHFARLLSLIQEGKLKPGVDATEFKGLESIPEAIDFMYERKNIGKIVVQL